MLYNLLTKNPSEKTLAAGIGFALSWSGDSTEERAIARRHPCDTIGSVGSRVRGECMARPTDAGLPHVPHVCSSQEKGGARGACGNDRDPSDTHVCAFLIEGECDDTATRWHNRSPDNGPHGSVTGDGGGCG